MSLKTLGLIARRLNCKFLANCRWKSEGRNSSHLVTNSEDIENETEKTGEAALPPEPTFCCMSGCANCVWIKYAQEITQLFDNGDVIAKKKISEKVHDPNLRAYLFKQLGLKDDDDKK